MKFSIQRDEIYDVLQRVVSVIPQRSTIAMTQNVLFTAEANQLELTTTDLEITMVSHVNATIEEEGAVAIPGRLIHDIIQELPNANLTFESDSNFRGKLQSDFGEYKIGGENPEEFPQKPQLMGGKEIVLPNQVLKRLIEKTYFATSTDELRPALTGVFFELENQIFKTVATDAHRFSMLSYQDEGLLNGSMNAIISTRALNFAVRGLDSEGLTATTFGEQHVLFHMENTKLYARLIEDTFLNYMEVIPTETNFKMTINSKDFLASVKRVSLFSNPVTAQIVLSIKKNSVLIEAEDIDFGGEAKEDLSCEFTGDNLIIGFNSRYLQQVLRHIDSDQMFLEFVRPDSAVLFKPEQNRENEDMLMILMPIRLENVSTLTLA